MARPAVFLDLNGTLILPVQVESLADYGPIPGSLEAVRLLNAAGYVCPVITVQSRIEKGIYTEAAFRAWFATFQKQAESGGAILHGPYLCPHRARTGCACHKPQPTLYLQAAHDLELDPTRSYVVGDTSQDIEAGQAIGAETALVLTGWGAKAAEAVRHTASFIGADVLAVARWIAAR